MTEKKLLADAKKAVARAKPIQVAIVSDSWSDPQDFVMVLLADGTRITGALKKVSKLTASQRAQIRKKDPELAKSLGMRVK